MAINKLGNWDFKRNWFLSKTSLSLINFDSINVDLKPFGIKGCFYILDTFLIAERASNSLHFKLYCNFLLKFLCKFILKAFVLKFILGTDYFNPKYIHLNFLICFEFV